MKQNVVVLYAGIWQITDEKTGLIKSEGCGINYCMQTDFSAVANPDGTMGLRSAKQTVDPIFLNTKIKKAPAMYEAEFGYKVDSKGKPVLSIVDLEYVGDVKLDFIPASKVAASPVK